MKLCRCAMVNFTYYRQHLDKKKKNWHETSFLMAKKCTESTTDSLIESFEFYLIRRMSKMKLIYFYH